MQLCATLYYLFQINSVYIISKYSILCHMIATSLTKQFDKNLVKLEHF